MRMKMSKSITFISVNVRIKVILIWDFIILSYFKYNGRARRAKQTWVNKKSNLISQNFGTSAVKPKHLWFQSPTWCQAWVKDLKHRYFKMRKKVRPNSLILWSWPNRNIESANTEKVCFPQYGGALVWPLMHANMQTTKQTMHFSRSAELKLLQAHESICLRNSPGAWNKG